MSSEFIIILTIIIFGLGVILFLIRKWLKEAIDNNNPSNELLEWLKNTNTRLDEQNKTIVATLQSSTRALNERLDNAARFIAAVQKNIGEMSEIGRGMKDLQDFLKSPKLRGNLGEQILKELLGQILPKQSFHLQYTFRSGVTVDAAINTSAGMIPVDSKFPMENFRKMAKAENDTDKKNAAKEFVSDVKKHIGDISRKYILTEEGTIDYALMYVPSEAVYYEIVNNQLLFEYAAANKVLPVSPVTFYAYLRAILMSFEGQKIEHQAKKILRTIKALQKDYAKVGDNLSVLSRHVTNSYNQMSNVMGSFTILGQKLSSTQPLEETKESKQLEI